MNDHAITHATFTLERNYPEASAQASRPGRIPRSNGVGLPVATQAQHNGMKIVFESFYRDIVADERLVYTSVLSQDDRPATVSLPTVELHPADDGTRLVLTEQHRGR